MIRLSLRLKAIADFISENSKVIDIGCDHGLLDIYLAYNKNCSCLATDISKPCVLKAKDNIKKYNLNKKIKTMVTNGLENIDYKNYDYVVISGMGFQTIQKILEKETPNKLIIQSNNNIEELKKYLFKRYKLIEEKVVYENDIYYVILYLEKGLKKYNHKDYILIKGNLDYINYLIEKNTYILNKMPKKYIIKRLKLYYKINVLKKYKNNFKG